MTKHMTGTREEWLAARLKLLKAEKELTRRSDELARQRQELPWVRIAKDYRFEIDKGSASLADLFQGRSQLLKSLKPILCLCLALTVSPIAFAAGPPDDAKAIQGRWTPIRAELGGQPMPEAVLKTISLKLENGRYEVLVGNSPDKGTYTIDPASNPKAITV